MSDAIICCTCNNNPKYIKYLYSLLSSINTNDHKIPVHVRLINSTSCVAREIERRHKNVMIQHDQFEDQNTQLINHQGPHITRGIKYLLSRYRKEVWGVYTLEAFYSCMIKYDTICHLLNIYGNVVYVDVDTIVRGSVSSNINEVRGFDMGLYFDKKIDSFPHAGLIVANNSDKTKNCMRNMSKYFEQAISSGDVKIGEGDGDRLYSNCVNTHMSVCRLPDKWKDEGHEFQDSSIMWSGRSERKHENKQYIQEYEKYLNK